MPSLRSISKRQALLARNRASVASANRRQQQKAVAFRTQKAATERMSSAARLARENIQFESGIREKERVAAFGRIQPFIQQIIGGGGADAGVGGGGGGGASFNADPESSPAVLAIQRFIEQRGEQHQGELSTAAARRGIFRSGPSLKAAAVSQGETEAQIAATRGQFVESARSRQLQDLISRRSTLSSLLGSLGSF